MAAEEAESLSETENFAVWRSRDEGEYLYHVELGGVTLHVESDEWGELLQLFKGIP